MADTTDPNYAPAFRIIRQDSGLSIRQLAMSTNVDRTKISRWERGQGTRMIREAILIARALDTSVEKLFAEDDDN